MTDTTPTNDHRVRLQNAVLALKKLQAQVDAMEAAKREPIAIIGMGCRLPGDVNTPEAFWRLLHDGIDTAGELPADRWDVEPLLDAHPYTPGRMFTRYGNYLRDISSFDPQFFGIAPREAASLDPQQRILLEVSWEALEHSGHAPDALAGSRTGIFIGVSVDDYAQFHLRSGDFARIDAYTCSGAGLCFGAGRLSYVLGLHGPCMTLDTACSSGLAAIHLACQSLRLGECEMALAGGINLILTPEVTIGMSALRALSPDGRSKAFDASADGFGRGEACGVIVLKRLSSALAAHDNIFAVIRGSAINHDGASGGLMVPNGLAQESLLRDALARAGVKPADVQYVEAHGTGTALGDPIELEALAAVMGEGRPKERPLVVGSVKTNIGHPEAASGVIGLIKVALALQNQEIPPHLHFRQPSGHIPWHRLPVIVPTKPVPWRSAIDQKRIAGVSAFGMSGTNVHVIVEEAPASSPASDGSLERPLHLLRLSAKTSAALRDMGAQFEQYLAEREQVPLADVCYSANNGRAHFQHRAAIVAATIEEARAKLRALASGEGAVGLWSRQIDRGDRPKIAFLFTGQGSQYAGMGRQLYSTQPTFRAALDQCAELLQPQLERPLLSILFAESDDAALLDETAYTQPALFALEYALAQLWRSWGIEPAAVLGYSVGEYAAACFAGILSLEDGLKLIAARGKFMQALPAGGAMAAIFADEASVKAALKPYSNEADIAAINGVGETVISGSARAIQSVLDGFSARGVNGQRLTVSHAFHSPLIEPMLDSFAEVAAAVPHHPPRIGLVSNLTGGFITNGFINASYWRRHARQSVQFVAGIDTLYAEGIRLFLEIGPKPTLAGIGRRVLSDASAVWLPSLRKDQDEWRQMLQSLATLHLHGARVDWKGFDRDYSRRRVSLPTYPFQRSKFWSPRPTLSNSPASAQKPLHPLLHRRVPVPLRETVFETTIDLEALPFLKEHRVQGEIVFPATAYIEMVLEAAREILGPGCHKLESIRFEQALVLKESRAETVQIALTPEDDGDLHFEICKRSTTEETDFSWMRLASGTIRKAVGAGHESVSLETIQAGCTRELSVDDYYQRLADQGLDYGSTFRGLRRIHRGLSEALGFVECAAQSSTFQCHPAVLDAALQVMAACFEDESTEGRNYIPISIDGLSLRRPLETSVWSYAVTRSGAGSAAATGDVKLLSATGEVLAVVEGLNVRNVRREKTVAVAPELAKPFYDVQWREAALLNGKAANKRSRWLIVPDRGGIAEQLAARLTAAGAECVVSESPRAGVDGVVYLPALDATISDAMDADAVSQSAVDVCAGALQLVQQLEGTPKLWLVTRGGQPLHTATIPTQASLWGLGSVIALEHSALQCVRLDLDPAEGSDIISSLVAELASDTGEDRVAWRSGKRYVARLVNRTDADSSEMRLAQTELGVLESLAWRPDNLALPKPGEVTIRVRATGLNFRDVLNALGMYLGDAGPLGDECAGTVTAVGPDVTNYAVGDEVVGLISGAFRTHVNATPTFVVPRPGNISPEAAAGIPIAYLTALYTLRHLARVSKGERVLIHAAAGGVGLAALHTAQRAGAEIFATAGNEEKRAFLAAQGVQHILDSRSLDFAGEIRRRTEGQGVHVVLNSLSGDFIPASLSVLAPHGRFIEIGKRDIWNAERVAAAYPTIEYHVFHLGTLMQNAPALVGSLLTEILGDVAAGSLALLPHREFSAAEASAAFRYMVQARHIGKIVVRQKSGVMVRSDRTYVISGGMGALGIRVAGWLVESGARHVALLGRSLPNAATQEAIRRLEAAGAQILAAAADVAKREDLINVFTTIENSMPPVAGVVHAAGVLHDGLLMHQDRSRLVQVMAPKVAGAWNLHVLTRKQPLDFFVVFSSIVAIAGTPGQGNYAAANAFLDAFAHYRRSLGLPALGVNWGAWGDTGMASQLSLRDQRRWADQGIVLLPPDHGINCMSQLLADGTIQACVLPIRWSKYLEQFSGGVEPLLYAEVPREYSAKPAASRPKILEQLKASAPNQRRSVLASYVRDQVVQTLGLNAAQPIDSQQPLSELGLDSLMAVEIRNALGIPVGRMLPVSLLYDYPTIDALTGYLIEQMPGFEADAAPVTIPEDPKTAQLQQVSEAEAEALLLKELEALNF